MFSLTRRSLIASAVAVPSALKAMTTTSTKLNAYIGTETSDGTAKGIYLTTFDTVTGELTEPKLIIETTSPTFLAKFGKTIFSVNEALDNTAAVSAFAMHPDHSLTLINKQLSLGEAPCHIAVHPSGKAFYVANYFGGNITSYNLAADGSLSKPVSHFQYEGKGPNPERQEKAHAHSVVLSPDHRFLLVNDLGLDGIHIYKIDESNPAKLTPNSFAFWAGTKGSGPRHLEFAPHAPYVYSLNELGSTIDLLKWDAKTGTLTTMGGPASTLPDTFKGQSTAAEIAITRDGLFCYTSNRGEDTIAAFMISPQDHGVTHFQSISCGGKTPRFFTLSPDERFVLAASQDSANIEVLKRDTKTGKLSATGHRIAVPHPMMLLFLD